VKFGGRSQNHGRKPRLLQDPGCQSNELATERSRGGQEHGLHSFQSQLPGVAHAVASGRLAARRCAKWAEGLSPNDLPRA
jgi:hypothetical protein